jgi:hypothetical protein
MTAYSAAVLAQSPLVYYREAETSGTSIADSSGNGETGTLHGTYTLSQSSLIGADRSTDYGIAFNGGTTSCASIPTANLPSGTSHWTGIVWISISGAPGGDPGVALYFGTWGSGSYEAFALGVSTSYKPKFTIFGYDLIGATALNLNQLYMLAATWDGTTMRLWQNVGSAVTNIVTGNSHTPNIVLANASIGGILNQANGFNGVTDEAAIFGTALSQSQLQTIYNAGAVELGATAQGDGLASANLRLVHYLNSTAQGDGSATATLLRRVLLTATAQGDGSASANLKLIHYINSIAQGDGSASANLELLSLIIGATARDGTINALARDGTTSAKTR